MEVLSPPGCTVVGKKGSGHELLLTMRTVGIAAQKRGGIALAGNI